MTLYVDWDVTSQTKQTEQNCMTELPTCRSANACLPACLNHSLTNLPTHPTNHSLWLAGCCTPHSNKYSLTNQLTLHSCTHIQPNPPNHSLTHPLTHSLYLSLTHLLIHSLTHSLTHSHYSLTSQVNSKLYSGPLTWV